MAWEEPRKTGMLYRRLGNSGLHVSVLGLGGWLTYVDSPSTAKPSPLEFCTFPAFHLIHSFLT